MANIIKRVWNQNRMVQIEDLKGMTFQAEQAGHTFQISGIDDDGNTVALTGTPSGVLLRPDNTDVALTCSVSGGVVSATLPANCYDVPGRFGLTIFITSGSSKTAIYAAVGTVTRTSSGTVAPGTTQSVVDLINAINAAINSIPASYSALLADIAPTYSDSALYGVGQYAWYDGDLKRCIVPITTAESYTAAHWTSAVLGQDVSDLKSAIAGETKTFIGYYDSQGSGIGGNIYKSSTLKLEKGQVLKTIKAYANPSSHIDNLVLFLLDSDNKIIKKVTKQASSLSSGWNTVDFENFYIEQDTYLAVSGGSVRFSYSTGEKTEYYSDGLFECSSSYVSSDVGDTLTFTQNVPGRYYEFSVEVEYYVRGINDRLNILEEKVDLLEGEISLTDFIMPKVRDTSEEGYTLIGKWYKFSSFDNCANCGGASIMFKVKGATNVIADIKQVVHPSHPEYVMSVEPYIAYSIDGGSFTRAQINSADSDPGITISIPSTDEHFVWIVIDGMCLTSGSANRSSGWSAVYIKSITTDGTMFKVEPASRQILFVGDSIVEGINTLGTTSTSESNSAVNEFPFKTARKLNSIAIYQGYGGSTSNGGIANERYSWIDASINKFILNNPDLIVVEYGYNDINAGYSESTFKGYYNTLLDLLASHYTGVPIICMIPFKQSFAKAIREMAAARSYCYCIETADYPITYSDTAHPDAAGATSIANSLSEDIINLITKEFFMD